MYQPKPINPSLLRLNAAAKLVLESINAGDIISASGREEQASDAANALQTAHELAFAEMHHQASPYLLFRKVSIHASRCREAKHVGDEDGLVVWEVSIHASRCREAKRRDRRLHRTSCLVSIHASRCREAKPPRRPAPRRGHRRFNPRLPLPGGEALA